MEFKSTLILLAIFMSSAVTVCALRCFSCQDVTSGPCFGPDLSNVTTIDCPPIAGIPSVCYKISGTTSDANLTIVLRGCVELPSVGEICLIATGLSLECVTCSEDLCN